MTRWLREKKDRRVPTTTDVFLLYYLGYLVQSFKIGLKRRLATNQVFRED